MGEIDAWLTEQLAACSAAEVPQARSAGLEPRGGANLLVEVTDTLLPGRYRPRRVGLGLGRGRRPPPTARPPQARTSADGRGISVVGSRGGPVRALAAPTPGDARRRDRCGADRRRAGCGPVSPRGSSAVGWRPVGARRERPLCRPVNPGRLECRPRLGFASVAGSGPPAARRPSGGRTRGAGPRWRRRPGPPRAGSWPRRTRRPRPRRWLRRSATPRPPRGGRRTRPRARTPRPP